ncbi:hypothetical protein J5N97_005459 [Dioscorea zingiberensis]|uniref:Uncharacterized protein n=1 Tax=Dioscorea zingiberensis TaxID=325984 RepID=A0A9D5D8G8_9LILI|nr:hypothetical protein J5N97_005459 [Dioscorea zingiberensis]
MAAALGSLPSLPALARFAEGRQSLNHLRGCRRRDGGGCWRAMVQPPTMQGASATYAREMERVSGKESLLLAITVPPRRTPATLANLLQLDLLIKDGDAKVTADIKFLNSVGLGTTQLPVIILFLPF